MAAKKAAATATAKAVKVKSAEIITSWPTPYSGLSIVISSQTDVSDVKVVIKTIPPFAGESIDHTTTMSLTLTGSKGKTATWKLSGMAIPFDASAQFEIRYTVNGVTHIDDNSGEWYRIEPTRHEEYSLDLASVGTPTAEPFEFTQVQDFFNDYQSHAGWHTLRTVEAAHFDTAKNQLELTFKNANNALCMMLLRLPTANSFRLRFNPGKQSASQYIDNNSRSIVMNSFDDLCKMLEKPKVTVNQTDSSIELITTNSSKQNIMKVNVEFQPFTMVISQFDSNGNCFPVMTDIEQAVSYKKRMVHNSVSDVVEEYSVVQAKQKPLTAKYIGFGEKGGYDLCKNSEQVTYFNFDNMKYSQIYGRGPLESREPLYHSNPFFMEFYGNPGQKSVGGIFIDNPSETFVDISCSNTEQYLWGSMYGDLDYYYFLGENCQDIIETFTAYVGKSRLKPRFALGYQQGCYGYDTYEKLQTVVNSYRNSGIPLDGLHVDVDLQDQYHTFTMNTEAFPEDCFKWLKDQGIKCSTNITPVISYLDAGDYSTFQSGAANGCFVKDRYCDNPDTLNVEGYYPGGVYYGGGRGTLGHYPDFGKKEVRHWWGQQYRMLYDRGLSMVWQDMTTPAIPDTSIRGQWVNGVQVPNTFSSDMRSFPFNLLVTDNFYKKYAGESIMDDGTTGTEQLSPAAKVRNMYSYNLHKATYHGINNIWCISSHSLASISGITTAQAETMLNQMASAGVIQVDTDHDFLYDVSMDQQQIASSDLGLSNEFSWCTDQVREILYQSIRLKESRSNTRNFIIGRGGLTGMHRFAGLWTGDNASEWDFLKINVSQAMALGLSGQAMSGEDIGGFEADDNNGKWADPELLMRWTMAGAFLPWFRNHYIAKGQKAFQEPYAYKELITPGTALNSQYGQWVPGNDYYMYNSVLPVCRRYINMRYELMQLFYDSMFENCKSGMPIVRAMFVNDTEDFSLFHDKISFLNDQFYVGKDLLVAPILEKQSRENGNGKRDVYLPAGSGWYQFKNNRYALGDRIDGGTIIQDYDASISSNWGGMNPDNDPHMDFLVPIFVREGAVIPSMDPSNYIGEYQMSPITINIYPGECGEYSMYLDDGISRDSAPTDIHNPGIDPMANDRYRETVIQHSMRGKTRTISIENVINNYTPNEDHHFVAIIHTPSEIVNGQMPLESITMNGEELECITMNSDDAGARALNNSHDSAWYYNRSLNISFVKVCDINSDQTIVAEYRG